MYSCEICEIFINILFPRTPPLTTSVFCKDFTNISYDSSHTQTRRHQWSQLTYFLTKILFSFVECIFPINETVKFTSSERYKIYSVFCLSVKSAIMETSLNKLILIVLQLTNLRENMWCQE